MGKSKRAKNKTLYLKIEKMNRMREIKRRAALVGSTQVLDASQATQTDNSTTSMMCASKPRVKGAFTAQESTGEEKKSHGPKSLIALCERVIKKHKLNAPVETKKFTPPETFSVVGGKPLRKRTQAPMKYAEHKKKERKRSSPMSLVALCQMVIEEYNLLPQTDESLSAATSRKRTKLQTDTQKRPRGRPRKPVGGDTRNEPKINRPKGRPRKEPKPEDIKQPTTFEEVPMSYTCVRIKDETVSSDNYIIYVYQDRRQERVAYTIIPRKSIMTTCQKKTLILNRIKYLSVSPEKFDLRGIVYADMLGLKLNLRGPRVLNVRIKPASARRDAQCGRDCLPRVTNERRYKMSNCAIMNCPNSTKNVAATKKITFHSFPKDPVIKNKWIEVTGRKNWFPNKNSRICSVHFHKDTFTGPSKYRRVISTAYPTIDVLKIISNDEEVQQIKGASSSGKKPIEKTPRKRKLEINMNETCTTDETSTPTPRKKEVMNRLKQAKQIIEEKDKVDPLGEDDDCSMDIKLEPSDTPQLHDAVAGSSTHASTSQYMSVVMDEYQIFANRVAEELRQFPPRIAALLQTGILSMINNERELLQDDN